jgi:hypothetical protein
VTQPDQTEEERELEARLLRLLAYLKECRDPLTRERTRKEYRELHARWMASRRQPRLGDERG